MKEITELQKFYKNALKALDTLEEDSQYAGGFYKAYSGGNRSLYLKQQTEAKQFDNVWLKTIESYLPSINRITINVKSNIKYQSEILPVEKTKRIGRESVMHLISHTHYIQEITEEGVLPKKVLTSLSETEYGIYENRFIMTLIKRLHDYLSRRIKIIKKQLKTTKVTHLNINSNFNYNNADYDMLVEIKRSEKISSKNIDEHNEAVLAHAEKLYRIISRLYSSQFMQMMKRFKPVFAPIMKTQVILKNPDFKNAYYLWLFLDKNGELGYDLNVQTVNKRFSPVYIKQLNQLHLMMFSSLLYNGGFDEKMENIAVKKKKAQTISKLDGESENNPVAFKVEDTSINEYYLNKSRQILKKQMDSFLEDDKDYKTALKKALESTLLITNSLFESYFSINTDNDVFKRLIQEISPPEQMEEAYEKLNIAHIVREVKEADYFNALNLETKWQNELASRQNNFIKYIAETDEKNTIDELQRKKEIYNKEISLINANAKREKQKLIREQKLQLAEHERKLKQILREKKAKLKLLNQQKLVKEKVRIRKLAQEKKKKEEIRLKLEKQQLKKGTVEKKIQLTEKYKEKK